MERDNEREETMNTEIVIGGDMADVPEGTYPATLTALSTKESPKFGGEFRVWTFKLDNGSEVEGNSSMHTNAKSKPGRWIAALLGRRPAEGEKVELIGRRCLVSVIENETGWPKVDAVLPPMATGEITAVGGSHVGVAVSSGTGTPLVTYEGMGDDDPRNVGHPVPELP